MIVRDARIEDHPAYERLFVELALPDPRPTVAHMASALPELIVACDGDEVVGYARWRQYGPVAHVVNVVTDPARRGQRIGQRLLEDIAARARASGGERWYLFVKQDNAAALALYRRCGLAVAGEAWALRIDWARALAMPDAPDARAVIVAPDDDAAFAAAFGYPEARLVSLRAREGGVLVGLFADRSPVGFAALLPKLPGAMPFAADAAYGGALLRACHAHAAPRFDYVRVSLEGNAALCDALVGAGATIDLAMLELRGAL